MKIKYNKGVHLGKGTDKELIDCAWALSGGAARAIALMRQVQVAKARGSKPNVIIGNSAGSLIAPIAAVSYRNPKILDEAIEFAETLDTRDMFPYKDNSPFNEKGKIPLNSKLRAMSFGHLGWQNIKPLYKKLFTEEYFELFKKSDIKCIAFGVKGEDWSPVEFVLNDAESIDDMIDMIECSSRIVPLVQPMEYKGEVYVDGGFISFNPAMWLFERYHMYNLVTMYSREVGNNVTPKSNWNKGVINIVSQALNGCAYWLGNKDALIEECYAFIHELSYIRLEAPDGYTDEIYEKDNHQLIALGNATYEKAMKSWDEYELTGSTMSLLSIN